ncbi:MAG TPA: ClbS/DfsB family four-helix bundle protein [Anaerolineae bacterium]
MDKQELLETIKTTQIGWEALLTEVGEARMTVAGVTGDWSIKDIIVHLTAWEERTVARLTAVRQGGKPEPAPWPKNLSEEEENAWIYEANRKRTLRDVLEDSRRVQNRLMKLLQSVTNEELNEAGRFSWLGGNKLVESIPGNTYEHYQEHSELIRKWLARVAA